jgi:hypothetical protein
MIVKSLDYRLSLSEPLGLLMVSQDIGKQSQMKVFHPKPFMHVDNHCLWRDVHGRRKPASCCMWVSLGAVSENFNETDAEWSSGCLSLSERFFLPCRTFSSQQNLIFRHHHLAVRIR